MGCRRLRELPAKDVVLALRRLDEMSGPGGGSHFKHIISSTTSAGLREASPGFDGPNGCFPEQSGEKSPKNRHAPGWFACYSAFTTFRAVREVGLRAHFL
jgi:hypothetical protein